MGVAIQVQSKKSEKTRKLIIDNATRVFMERGFRNVSVEQLCNIVGVSRGTFYNYFPSRDALVETVFDECFAEAFPAIDKNFKSDGNIEQIIETHYNLVIELIMSKISARMLADLEILMPQTHARVEEMRKYEVVQLIKLIKRGQDESLIRKDIDPEVVSTLLEEIIGSVTRPGFIISKNLTLKQVGSTIKTIFLHGIMERNEK